MSASSPKYVFRGTTYNFAGGRACVSKPYRCFTSRNPLVAYYYAKVCPYDARGSVVYVAEYQKLIDNGVIELVSSNPSSLPVSLIEADEEVIWEIKPLDFNKLCEGYVTLDEMQTALIKIGRPPHFQPISLGELTMVCNDATSRMSAKEIEKVIKIIKRKIKYP